MAVPGMLLQMLMVCPLVLVIVVDMLSLDCSRKCHYASLVSSLELSIHIKGIFLHVRLHILLLLRVTVR